MKGLEIIARYAFAPNSKHYCGPENTAEKITQFINGKFTDSKYLKNAFSKFEVMFPYLQLIAKANNKNPFDFKVAEAYWVGNELLEKVSLQDWKKTALQIGKNSSWEKKIIDKYASFIKPSLLPHHSFHVLASSLSTINNEEILLEKINSCLITWGKVLNVEEKKIIIEKKQLILSNKTFEFGERVIEKVKNVFNNNDKIVQCNVGDFISMHWGFACKKLEKKELQILKKFTEKNLKEFKT